MNNATVIEMANVNATLAARVRCTTDHAGARDMAYVGSPCGTSFEGMKHAHIGNVPATAKWSHFAFPTTPQRLHEPPGR